MTMPVRPCRGPHSIRATFPTWTYGQGIVPRPLPVARWIASISSSGTAIGVLPTPTIWITPGACRTGSRSWGFILQKRYPGKSGDSTCFTRSDQRRLVFASGSRHSNPLFSRNSLAVFSRLVLDWIANHGQWSRKSMLQIPSLKLPPLQSHKLEDYKNRLGRKPKQQILRRNAATESSRTTALSQSGVDPTPCSETPEMNAWMRFILPPEIC